MNMPENLMITYHTNGCVRSIYEVDDSGRFHGICISWYSDGKPCEDSFYVNGEYHGISIYRFATQISGDGILRAAPVTSTRYYHYGHDITNELKTVVADITNIQEFEKTQVALQYGIVL